MAAASDTEDFDEMVAALMLPASLPQRYRFSLQQRHLNTQPRAECHRQAWTWGATAPQTLKDEQQGR
jgi:hypothetical protein